MQLSTITLTALLACANALLIPNLEAMKNNEKRGEISEDSAEAATADAKSTVVTFRPRDEAYTIPWADPDHPSYIVVLKKGHKPSEYKAHDQWVQDQVTELQKRGDLEQMPEFYQDGLQYVNASSFKGYTGYLPPTLLEAFTQDPMVDFIEEDSLAEISGQAAQENAPWGIARISQRNLNLKGAKFNYDDQAGKGVTAYVIDTGVKTEHPDFEGRATWGEPVITTSQVDENGHGTHVAGILGGKTYGVAKKVDLVSVAVFGASGRGPMSNIIKGLEYAVRDHQAKVRARKSGYKGATINLSVAGSISPAVDSAVNAALDAGLHVVVAAANNDQDACGFSPGRVPGAITVGATLDDDSRAWFSNYGSCVDIQAPGLSIRSVGINQDSINMSGTSMSAPHVSGVVATFLSLQPGLGSEFSASALIKPADMKKKLVGFGTRGLVKDLDSASPNVIVYNGAGGDLSELWRL